MSKKLDNVETDIELEKRKMREDDKSRRRYIFLVLIFLVILFFTTFGITVSFYRGTPSGDNTIITDKIVFTYSDVDGGGNGIFLNNAVPTSDAQGKVMIGKSEYFDFSVTATSKTKNIKYKVLAKKDASSTLANSDVRIYLASRNSNYDDQVLLNTFSNLEQETIDGTDYYVLYEKTLDKDIENYSDFYRLKMWIREGATDYYEKMFALKVDVVAVQVGD